MNEQWKPVVGYEGLYEVSDLGRVKSLTRTIPDKTFGTKNITGRFLSLTPHRKYVTVRLSKNHKSINALVHRLVIQAFVGECPEGLEVCHKNGIGTDNQLSNLRYGTHKSNMSDRLEHGTSGKGSDNSQAKLTDKDIAEIKWARSFGFTHQAIADYFNVCRQTITLIINNKRWSHI